MECAEDGCTDEVAVEMHIPWDENRFVCTAHARVLSREDGIVADPIEENAEDWQ